MFRAIGRVLRVLVALGSGVFSAVCMAGVAIDWRMYGGLLLPGVLSLVICIVSTFLVCGKPKRPEMGDDLLAINEFGRLEVSGDILGRDLSR